MVDFFALALSHGLLALVAWRLMQRNDLENDPPEADPDANEDPAARAEARTRIGTGHA